MLSFSELLGKIIVSNRVIITFSIGSRGITVPKPRAIRIAISVRPEYFVVLNKVI